MRLNIDCIRDILLTIESAKFNQTFTLPELCKELSKYNKDEIHYTCAKLCEGKYLDAVMKPYPGKVVPAIIRINGLTYEGHKFVDTIRDSKIWAKTKSKIGQLASVSLNVVEAVAGQAITELLFK